MSRLPRLRNIALALALCVAAAGGCRGKLVDPARATRAYPMALGQGSVVQIQAIPAATDISIVNATAVSYANFDLWLNQRYVCHVDALGAGQTIRVPIIGFYDQWGEKPYPGGLLQTFDPTPIVLLQIETAADQPLVGLVCALPETMREQ